MGIWNKIKGKEQLNLDPNEIAFRKIYRGLLEAEKITVIFRPGKRLCGDFRGYCNEQKVTIRLLDAVGADWAMVPPKFVAGFAKEATIETVETKPLGEFSEQDFYGSSPDLRSKESLRYYLGIIYNLDDSEINDDFLVTKTTFNYQQLTSLQDFKNSV